MEKSTVTTTLKSWQAILVKYAPVVADKTWRWLRFFWYLIRIAVAVTWTVLQRVPIAVISCAQALRSAEYAEQLRALHAEFLTSLPSPSALGQTVAPAAVLQQAPPDSALVLLSLLQKEGRLIDFVQEDIQHYSDADIGSAARVIHSGCRKVLKDHLTIVPVLDQAEGNTVTLERGFDPAAIKPTGNVVGEPPFRGTLMHRGWRADAVQLPQVASSRDVRILAAAEVEL